MGTTELIQVRQGVVTLGSEPRMFTSNMTALSYLPPKDKRKPDPEISKGTWPRAEVWERQYLEPVWEKKPARRSEWTSELMLSRLGGICPGGAGGRGRGQLGV